jgi:predicted dehydrogenase
MRQLISRRSFVKTSSQLTLLTGLATVAHPSFAAPTASDEVTIGLMGGRIRGQSLVEYFTQIPGVKIAYVCDVDREVADKCNALVAARQGSAAAVVSDFRRVLDDPAIDGLVVAAPDHWHAVATAMACDAGKHVYCEKPATHNVVEGAKLIDAVKRSGRVVQTGTQRRSSESLRNMVEFLRGNGIGKIHFARAWIASQRPSIGHAQDESKPPQTVDYDMWLGPAPLRAFNENHFHYNWHWQWEYGSGEIGNNGIHGLDLARWALGVGMPLRVNSTGGKYTFQDDQVTPDTQIACFEYPELLLMWEHRTWSPHTLAGSMFGVEFHGAEGVVTTDGKAWHHQPYGEKSKAGDDSNAVMEPAHQANWIKCIRDGGTPAADIKTGVMSANLCHLANVSQRVGRHLDWDDEQQQFADSDSAANELLKRTYRTPWEFS